jgi:cobalt-zinc-cadmium efflux system protein
VAAILIGIVVLRSSISIAWESLHTLLEAAPPGVHVDSIADEIAGKFDNIRLHHLHVWEVGPGQRVLTAHMKVGGMNLVEVEAVAAEVRSFLREKWGITHATLEAETNGCGREHLLGEWK